jgi:hypothetical protein
MLQFSTDAVNDTQPVYNPEWPVRYVAMQVYYANYAYRDAKGNGVEFTSNITSLLPYAQPLTLNGSCTNVPAIQLTHGGKGFTAQVQSSDGSLTAHIRDDRYLTVTHNNDAQ